MINFELVETCDFCDCYTNVCEVCGTVLEDNKTIIVVQELKQDDDEEMEAFLKEDLLK